MKRTDVLLRDWRISKVMPFVPEGSRVLDIGCGDGALLGRLASRISSGLGLDPELAGPMVRETYRLQPGHFPGDRPGEEFDVVTMLAVLEHVPPAHQAALVEGCAGCLAPGGRVVVTVPGPSVDRILHVLMRLRVLDGMEAHQHYGFEVGTTPSLFADGGFTLLRHRRFQLGVNNLFVFEKPRSPQPVRASSRGTGSERGLPG